MTGRTLTAAMASLSSATLEATLLLLHHDHGEALNGHDGALEMDETQKRSTWSLSPTSA
jgi:hypothetical protein